MADLGEVSGNINYLAALVAHQMMMMRKIVVVADCSGAEIKHFEFAEIGQLTKNLVDRAQRHVGHARHDLMMDLLGCAVAGERSECFEHGQPLAGDLQIGVSETLGQCLRASHLGTIPNINNDC